ncbi:F-box/LRR-repeat protein 3-like [Arachis duranensis]|uniref:F-box/LRR-repeat protein 3-like n=1 Tax=Arachis duranensis TaxID=130453 RepID=A0A6P4BZA6_ARADU|nr:F-box/LRR-repeat protein 3-like [Arachis duranensis]
MFPSSRICRHQELHLPDECWELVFKHLSDPLDHESLSLVSRHFLSLTNGTHTDLAVSDRVLPLIPVLLRRFPNLTTIKITRYFTGDINALLSQIASFNLPSLHSLDLSHQPTFPSHGLRQFSEKFSALKSLNCSHARHDLDLVAECFPNLEEIDVSFRKYKIDIVSDWEKALTSGLKKLRKVTISGNFTHGDSYLLALCHTCVFLEELVVIQTGPVSMIGIANAIRKRPELRSLSVNCLTYGFFSEDLRKGNVTLEFIDALVSLKGLNCLDLYYSSISDEALSTIAEESLPLRKLSLRCCKGYGYGGISYLLRKCNNLQYLDLQMTQFLNDQCVVELSLLLGNLKFVKLSDNAKLTDLSLFAIMRNCPLITDIRMESTGIGKQKLQEDCLVVNSHVKFLYLASNTWLDDETVTMLAAVCPNLEMIDLSKCGRVSKGAIDVLWSCRKIRRMDLALLGHELFQFRFRVCFDVPTLFVLNLSQLSISNEELYLISKSCCKLKELDLESCHKITTRGVKQMVKNCKQLRTISLAACEKVSANVVAWMVSARPSLRKIRPPPRFSATESQRDLFRRHGCFVGKWSN